MDVANFFVLFQDHLAPTLDTYEQALYLFIFRHSRLLGLEEAVIGFKSARTKVARGVGEAGKAMAEGTCYEKLRSLQAKGCIELITTERSGTRVKLRLPNETPGIVPVATAIESPSFEQMDFYEVQENRLQILVRENYRCFYCSRTLTDTNYLIEHVVSRPEGSNNYRNVVAACLNCNNRKGASNAEDFLRTLYRDGFLGAAEFEACLSKLQRLKAGQLAPKASGNKISQFAPSGDKEFP